jgi:hypothetical protein
MANQQREFAISYLQITEAGRAALAEAQAATAPRGMTIFQAR